MGLISIELEAEWNGGRVKGLLSYMLAVKGIVLRR